MKKSGIVCVNRFLYNHTLSLKWFHNADLNFFGQTIWFNWTTWPQCSSVQWDIVNMELLIDCSHSFVPKTLVGVCLWWVLEPTQQITLFPVLSGDFQRGWRCSDILPCVTKHKDCSSSLFQTCQMSMLHIPHLSSILFNCVLDESYVLSLRLFLCRNTGFSWGVLMLLMLHIGRIMA